MWFLHEHLEDLFSMVYKIYKLYDVTDLSTWWFTIDYRDYFATVKTGITSAAAKAYELCTSLFEW